MRLKSIVFPLLVTAACTTPGDRNQSGECPAGEICSSDTPYGLTFDGAEFGDLIFDNGLQMTAVGGTQTVTVIDPETTAPLRRAYVAGMVGASHITGQVGPLIEVEAVEAGSARLRIESAADGALYDRVDLASAAIDRIELRSGTFVEVTEDRGKALWRGAPVNLVVALLSASNQRLADESMTLSAPGANQGAWDQLNVTGTGDALTIEIAAGGRPAAPLTIPVVGAVDRIVTSTTLAAPATVALDAVEMVCFVGLAGDDQVLGAPWVFSGSGAQATLSNGPYRNCLTFRPSALGTVTISAQIGEVRHQVDVQVVNAARAIDASRQPVGPTPGERAATVSDE